MKKLTIIILSIFCVITSSYIVFAQQSKNNNQNQNPEYPKAYVDYDDFKNLVSDVDKHRADRLVSLDEFLKMSKNENTIILDTRSDSRYNRKHIKGAVHLDFTDFTQENLLALIPDMNTRILIYCNNNFQDDPIDFASKISSPMTFEDIDDSSIDQKPIMLALNIPTYINLYGYGYRNIYELDELVSISDPRIEFEGTEVE